MGWLFLCKALEDREEEGHFEVLRTKNRNGGINGPGISMSRQRTS